MPADNSLGETLGNLGQSLANNFNPLKQMQAYELQRRMWMQDEQLRQEQRKNAATQAAIGQYAHIVPSEFMPEIANMIYQNAPADQILRRVALRSGRLIDATDDESLRKNIEFMRQIDPTYSYSKDGPPVGGAVTAKAFDDWKVNEAGRSATSTALGTKTGEQIAADTAFAGAIDDTTPEATANNVRIIEKVTGKPWDQPYPPPITPKTIKAAEDWKVANAGALKKSETEGTNTGNNATLPRDLTKTQAYPPPGGFDSTGAPPAAPPVQQTMPVPKGATPDPNRPGAYWTGGVYHAPINTTGPVTGIAPGDQDITKTTNEGAAKTLTDAYSAGEAATKLKTITNQIRGLSQIANNAGFWGQGQAGINAFLGQYNLGGITSAQQAQQAMNQLMKTELPSMLKQFDIVRFAKPEIDLMSGVTGSGELAPPVINGILANLDAGADYILKRKGAAGQTLGYDPSTPMNYPEFQAADKGFLDTYSRDAEARRAQYGAIGANAQPRAPVVQTQGGATPTPSPFQWLGDLFHNLGQPNAPQPVAPQSNETPPPGSTPSRELRYDPATNTWQ